MSPHFTVTGLTKGPFSLYGITLNQAYRYFRLYPKDLVFLKSLVCRRSSPSYDTEEPNRVSATGYSCTVSRVSGNHAYDKLMASSTIDIRKNPPR